LNKEEFKFHCWNCIVWMQWHRVCFRSGDDENGYDGS